MVGWHVWCHEGTRSVAGPTHMISMQLGESRNQHSKLHGAQGVIGYESYVHCAEHRAASCSRVTQYLAQRSSTPSEEEGASLALTQGSNERVHAQWKHYTYLCSANFQLISCDTNRCVPGCIIALSLTAACTTKTVSEGRVGAR
jgi:hypothetical protein